MQPYQERVIAERDELEPKITRLSKFLDSETCRSLPEAEQARLLRQLGHMNGYHEVLDERINAFT